MATAKTNEPVRIRGFYTCEQAADWLGMKADTIRRYVHRGLIQAGVLGGIYLIAEAELKRFQKERRSPGNPSFTRQSA